MSNPKPRLPLFTLPVPRHHLRQQTSPSTFLTRRMLSRDTRGYAIRRFEALESKLAGYVAP